MINFQNGIIRTITAVFFLATFSVHSHAAKIRVGVLAYGTVNWELDTVKHPDLVLDQHHIAEVQVAVAFAYETFGQSMLHRALEFAVR